MKNVAILLTALLFPASAFAQLSVTAGNAFYVSAGNILSVDSLIITPAGNMNLNGISIQRNATTVATSTGQSVVRVYSFSSPLVISGTAGMYYDTTTLNGNTAGSLALYRDSTGAGPFQQDTGSTDNSFTQYASYVYTSPRTVSRLTLGNAINPLPVTLLSYSAVASGGCVQLNWETAAEINCDYFEILHSIDGLHFTSLLVHKSEGELYKGHAYHDYDLQPANGTNYYRLLEHDKNGAVKDYGTRTVAFVQPAKDNVVAVWPNPCSNIMHVTIPPTAYTGTIILTDNTGRIVLRLADAKHEVPVDVHSLATGIYLLHYSDDTYDATVEVNKL